MSHEYFINCPQVGWLNMEFEVENMPFDGWAGPKLALYQLTYNRDTRKLIDDSVLEYTEQNDIPDFETILHFPIALSMICDDGMTSAEAKKLLTNTYKPFVADNGFMTTVYAPRDVVHLLQEDPETGEITYSAMPKEDYEADPLVYDPDTGEALYTDLNAVVE